ncbi:SDR family oxidoreductase [Thalassobacillus hwangdonensis]|uniref:SDR family oxidoreductase n=1 Tax=Thalassobacillus hwangdonensis TaxID=546108 RepID=A0ABW3L3F9_9BACI
MNENNKKIALVTGVSCDRDMGTAFCRQLASQGFHILFTQWQAEAAWKQTFQSEITEQGVRCEGIEIDLSSDDAALRLLDWGQKTIGLPTVLVNNAAYSTSGSYSTLDGKILDAHYAVNMRTTFMLCVEFARRLENSEIATGRIINITSGQELGPMPGELAYVATKGAISAFTKSLSAEVAHLGITVNAINPGPTDTTWMDEEIRNYLRPKFGMGRIGEPEDAARLVGFLASEDARWITGQVIHSEGGFLRS